MDEGKAEIGNENDELDFDGLQDKFGGITRYQIGIILLVSILPFGTGFISQVSVFFSAVPEHRCALPPFENDPPTYEDENITKIFIPCEESDGGSCETWESCGRYDYNLDECYADLNSCLSDNETSVISCDHGFVYSDEYYKETTVSQFNLVCGRSTLDAVANSMYFVGVFIGSALIGPLMDWFGRKVSMLIMCIGLLVTNLLVAFSSSYEMYISMRVLQAITAIPCFIAYYTYVNEITTKRWKTLVGAYANTITAVSHTVLPLLAYFLRYWRNLGICVTVLCTPYFIIYFFIPKSPRWLVTKKRDDEAKKVIKKYAKSVDKELRDEDWNLVLKTENDKLSMAATQARYTVLDLFKPSLMRTVSINTCYLWFVTSMVFYGLTLNVGTLVGNPYVNSLFNGFVEIVGYGAFLGATRLVGMRITGSLSYFLSGICCLITMLLYEFADGNRAMEEASRWIAILGKLFATAAFGLIYQYTTELYPTVARGTAMSMGSMSARIGSIIMPFTLQLQKTIPWLTQTIFGTLAIIGGATCLFLPETLNAGLISTMDDAENFYRKNMKLTASLMGKTNKVYHSKSKSEETTEGYEFDYENEKLEKRQETKF